MCGRFTLKSPPKVVAELFGLDELPDWEPRYNIAPTQMVAAVRQKKESPQRELALLHWGLIPPWAEDPAIGNRMINARSETAAEKPSFKKPLRSRRCLVVADGFYEWQKQGKQKQPYYIRRQDGQPFAIAGLWECWKRQGPVIESCTLLTTEANALMAPLHERMPVILDPADWELWLDPNVEDAARVQPLLAPADERGWEAVAVSTRVNNPRHEAADCIEPLE